jgi:hypothetical protein
MEQYIVIAYYKVNGNSMKREFTLIGDTYPRVDDILSTLGVEWDDLIDYEIHY